MTHPTRITRATNIIHQLRKCQSHPEKALSVMREYGLDAVLMLMERELKLCLIEDEGAPSPMERAIEKAVGSESVPHVTSVSITDELERPKRWVEPEELT